MMRGGRYNSQCSCCNDDVCDGFRTREKNEWKKEVAEELTYDNFINALKQLADEMEKKQKLNDTIYVNKEEYEYASKYLSESGLKAHLAVYDELNSWQYIEPQIFKVSAEEYDKLEKLLSEPPKLNERLRRLLKGKE